MARITINAEQWSDLVLVYMLDTLKKKKIMDATSPAYKEVVEKLGQALKPKLVVHYIHMDPEIRVKYRLIRTAFDGKGHAGVDITEKATTVGREEKEK